MPRTAKPKTWQALRRLAYVRASAQARYRREKFVDWQTYCELWNSETLIRGRGREPQDLTMSKINFEEDYSRQNCCIARRRDAYSIRRYYQIGYRDYKTYIPDSLIIRKLS